MKPIRVLVKLWYIIFCSLCVCVGLKFVNSPELIKGFILPMSAFSTAILAYNSSKE